jgi:hypothetical protein
MRTNSHSLRNVGIVGCLTSVVACSPPDVDRMFNGVEVSIEADAESANQHFIDAIQTATTSLYVGLPEGEDLAVSDAILEAMDRGVEVEVIADIDNRDAPAIKALLDADVPLTLADDDVAYFDFNINIEVRFPSEDCVFSHAYAVVDHAQIISANRFGATGPGTHVLYDVKGEELIEDLLWEHNQIYGGVDATTTTAYDANAKSMTDPRWGYMTNKPVQLGLSFGPQERLVKQVIDAVYGARVSVRIITNDFANPELAKALQDKAMWGIDTEVIVGSEFDKASPDVRLWFGAAKDVHWTQTTRDAILPTIVLVDFEPDDTNNYALVKGMVLTHSLLSGARLYRSLPTPSDQLIDGTMWVIDQTEAPGVELQTLLNAYEAELAKTEDL